MSLRPRDTPPRDAFLRDHFHGRYICKRCSAECHDWVIHRDEHAEVDGELEYLRGIVEHLLKRGGEGPGEWHAEQVGDPGESLEELAARSRAEGLAADAAAGESRASFLGGGLRQAREIFRLRPPPNGNAEAV